jgi:hypothetical protein
MLTTGSLEVMLLGMDVQRSVLTNYTLQFQQTITHGHMYKLMCSYHLLLVLHNSFYTCL